MGAPKLEQVYSTLKEKSGRLGRTFLTRYEVGCILKENYSNEESFTDYLRRLEERRKIEIREHDITLTQRLKMIHLR